MAALGQLLGVHNLYTSADIVFSWQYYWSNEVLALLLVASVGATLLGNKRVIALYEKCVKNELFYLIQEIVVVCLLVISISFMISSNYSPFIYFQF